jgi:oligoendopeptidase F
MNDQIKFGAQVADITNIYLKHETLIKKYLCDKDLKKYERYFSLVFRDRPHVLNDENETLLTKISPINSGFGTIFDTLTDTDIKYQDAIDKNKRKIPLKTISDITINLKHHDRCLRKST